MDTLFVSPQNSYVKDLTPNVIGAFGRWGLWEVIRFKGNHEDGAFMMGLVPLSEEDERPELFFPLLEHIEKVI